MNKLLMKIKCLFTDYPIYLKFVFWYVSVMMIFTVIYCLFPPHSFYFNNLHRELLGSKKSEYVVSEVVREIYNQYYGGDRKLYSMNGKNEYYEYSNKPLSLALLNLTDLGGIEFGGNLPEVSRYVFDHSENKYQLKDAFASSFIRCEIRLGSFSIAPNKISGICFGGRGIDEISLMNFILDGQYESVEQINFHEGREAGETEFTIEIKLELYNSIKDLAMQLRGEVLPDGYIWKYLYLAVATTTTLGYGDITPVTTWARLAASINAIVGVFVVALYGGILVLNIKEEK